MDDFRIQGGGSLRGEVTVHGSKNASLLQLAASLLASDSVALLGVPWIGDVRAMLELFRCLGVEARRLSADRLSIHQQGRIQVAVPGTWAQRLRASICLLGPLLARHGAAVVPLPGGCRLGHRGIEVHLRGLAALGAELSLADNRVTARAGRLRGARIDVGGPRGPTVTGTANVLMACVLARGSSLLVGAAREPEIVDLVHLLRQCGAQIEGEGTDELHVIGVPELGGGCHRVIPDRLEAATLAIGATMTQGSVRLKGIRLEHLAAVLQQLEHAGATLTWRPRRANGTTELSVCGPPRPRAVQLKATAYPGFPTDLQPLFTALAALAVGNSLIEDRVFPGRWTHLPELRKLGVRCYRRAEGVAIEGVPKLNGGSVQAHDLRCGAALLLAGLATAGETRVQCAAHIDRGYQRLDATWRALGGRIHRVSSVRD